MLKFEISLSDVDRGNFRDFELRVARHPSETSEYLVTRTLAACLFDDERLSFAPGGISEKEIPPLYIDDGQGRMKLWIEIGAPGVDRLDKARRRSERLVVVTTDGPRLQTTAEKANAAVHILWLPKEGVKRIADALEGRTIKWQVTRSGGVLFVTTGDDTHELVLTEIEVTR